MEVPSSEATTPAAWHAAGTRHAACPWQTSAGHAVWHPHAIRLPHDIPAGAESTAALASGAAAASAGAGAESWGNGVASPLMLTEPEI